MSVNLDRQAFQSVTGRRIYVFMFLRGVAGLDLRGL